MTSTNTTPEEPSPQFRILVPEKLSTEGLALLESSSLSLQVDLKLGLTVSELEQLLPSYDALIIRSETKCTSSLLAHGTRLKVIARAGVGVDNIDVAKATEMGIIVVNSPAGNVQAAAEHTIALLMAVARNVPAGWGSLRAGKWERSKLVGVEIKGKVLGIVGLGKVGLLVARMAVGLGLKVQGLDPYVSKEVAESYSVQLVPSLAELLPAVDFLTLHTPLLASTKGLISTKELESMKKTARVLNVARGGVIDEEALLQALEDGAIAGAGIDVFTSEPPAEGSSARRLVECEKVVATPHLGASTVEAMENVSLDVCTQVLSILSGNPPTSAINAPLILPEEYSKLQPFVRLVEKIGSLYIQHYHPHTTSTFDLIYEGSLTSISNTRPLFAALVKGLTSSVSARGGRDVNIVNAPLIAKERGIVINESFNRGEEGKLPYSALVTLRAGASGEQLIQGYVSSSQIFISRLDRFTTNFVPSGNLLILHNYDKPGKIGSVGSVLGREGVNIGFMSVAPLSAQVGTNGKDGENEALMILGVDREVDKSVVQMLGNEEGILDVSIVNL